MYQPSVVSMIALPAPHTSSLTTTPLSANAEKDEPKRKARARSLRITFPCCPTTSRPLHGAYRRLCAVAASESIGILLQESSAYADCGLRGSERAFAICRHGGRSNGI